MKQKDVVLIGVMVFISALFSFLLSGWIFNKPQNRRQTAEVVDVITAEFRTPPETYFNATSVNPTQLITIGGSTNPNPFNNKPQ